MLSSHRASVRLLCLLLSPIVLFIGGCSAGSSTTSSSDFRTTSGIISGRVNASQILSPGPAVRSDLRALFNVASATVWLQSHPEIRTTTASNGTFLLQGIPYGNARIVAKTTTSDQKTFKTRSNSLTIDNDQPAVDVGQLLVEVATNQVRILLLDADGQPIPNATLTLWGEPCQVDGNGVYLSPPLPDAEQLEEILIWAAAGQATGSIIAPFTSGGTPVVVTRLSRTGDRNKPPNVWLTSWREPADKITPSEVVKLWSVSLDTNPEDRDALGYTWRWTGGSLASASHPFPENLKRRVPNLDWSAARVVSVEWTAPAQPALYKVEVTVIDPSGANGKAQYPLNVYASEEAPPSTPPINQAPVAVIVAPATVVTGTPIALRVIASDSDLDLLRYEWAISPSAGMFSAPLAEITTWTAPLATGQYQIRCQVTELRSTPLSAMASCTVTVVSDPIVVFPGMIAGHVLDEQTRQPIASAVVAIAGTNRYTIADGTGYFEFRGLSAGTYTLIATRNGYLARSWPGIVVPE